MKVKSLNWNGPLKMLVLMLALLQSGHLDAQITDSMRFYMPVDLNIKGNPMLVISKDNNTYQLASKLISKDSNYLIFLITINKDSSGNILYQDKLILKDSLLKQYFIITGKLRKFYFTRFEYTDLSSVKNIFIQKRQSKHVKWPIRIWYKPLSLPILPSKSKPW